MRAFLIVNPRSGSARPSADELVEEARRRGVDVHLFRSGEDLEAIAREVSAEAIGMAGGDGSLAPVASVAIERGLPFVCVPFGTRNHFARDLGLDRDDPIAALDAFGGVAPRRRRARRGSAVPQQRLARDVCAARPRARAASKAA